MGKFPCVCTFTKWIACHQRRHPFVSYRRPTKLDTLMDYFPCLAMLGYGGEEIGKCSCQWLYVALGRERSPTKRECVTWERGWVLLSSCVSYIQNLLGLNEHRWQFRINREFFSPQVRQIHGIFHIITTLLFLYWIIPWGPYSYPTFFCPEAKTKALLGREDTAAFFPVCSLQQ